MILYSMKTFREGVHFCRNTFSFLILKRANQSLHSIMSFAKSSPQGPCLLQKCWLLTIWSFLLLTNNSCFVNGQRGNRYCPGIHPVRIRGKLPSLGRQTRRKCDDPKLGSFRSFDGQCTHPRYPSQGSARTPFHSYFGKSFSARNMSGSGLASAREISNTVFHQFEESVLDDQYKLTEFTTFFGQFLDHSIVLTSNDIDDPTAVQDIPVKKNDVFCKSPFIKFNRNKKSDRRGSASGSGWLRSINVLPSAVDLFGVYGGPQLANELRLGKGGLMRTTGGSSLLLPLNDENINRFDSEMNAPKAAESDRRKFFIAGDSRSNENPQLTALHTLFLRVHNSIAVKIKWDYPDQSDEWIFQSARRVNQALFQKIVYNEYLPAMIGEKLEDCPVTPDGVHCFNEKVRVMISDIFASAAFRVGHTMVGNFVHREGRNGEKMAKLLLREVFFSNTSLLNTDDIGPYIRGIIKNQAQKIDNNIVDALRNNLFENTPGEEGFDLAAINIQRGRDVNLPTFAEVKKKFLGVRVTSFKDISTDRNVRFLLEEVYSVPQQVELWPGLLCEDHADGRAMGPTLIAIWKAEFERLRNGDAYFYLNKDRYDKDLLEFEMLKDIINGTGPTMRELIIQHTDINDDEIPQNIWKID